MDECNHQQPHLITKQTVRVSYELYKDQCTDKKAGHLQIINILKMDLILHEFLDENNVIITQNQLNRLNQIFITPDAYAQKCGTLSQIVSSDGDEQTLHNYTTHIFDTTNSSLYDIFGDNVATKVSNALHSVWLHLITPLAVALYAFLRFTIPQHIIFILYSFIFPCFVVMCYCIICLLSINKKGASLILRTFEFWVKIGYVVTAFVLQYINRYNFAFRLVDKDEPGQSNNVDLQMVSEIWISSNLVLFLIIVSMLDAIHMPRATKVILPVGIAMLSTLVSAYIEYITYFNGEQSMVYVHDTIGISLLSMQQNAMRVWILFLWKQSICTMLISGRSTLIKHSPYIEWKTESDSQAKINPDTKSNTVATQSTVVSPHTLSIDPTVCKALPEKRKEEKATDPPVEYSSSSSSSSLSLCSISFTS